MKCIKLIINLSRGDFLYSLHKLVFQNMFYPVFKLGYIGLFPLTLTELRWFIPADPLRACSDDHKWQHQCILRSYCASAGHRHVVPASSLKCQVHGVHLSCLQQFQKGAQVRALERWAFRKNLLWRQAMIFCLSSKVMKLLLFPYTWVEIEINPC